MPRSQSPSLIGKYVKIIEGKGFGLCGIIFYGQSGYYTININGSRMEISKRKKELEILETPVNSIPKIIPVNNHQKLNYNRIDNIKKNLPFRLNRLSQEEFMAASIMLDMKSTNCSTKFF